MLLNLPVKLILILKHTLVLFLFFLSDTYFKIMIFMMTFSVFATVIVINLASRSVEPIPKWMAWLVLNKMSHIVCLRDLVKLAKADLKSNVSQSDSEVNDINQMVSISASFKDTENNNLNDSTMTRYNAGYDQEGAFDEDWKLIAFVVTRFFALAFFTVVVVNTVTILLYIWLQSKIEFENALGYLKDEWQKDTYITS